MKNRNISLNRDPIARNRTGSVLLIVLVVVALLALGAYTFSEFMIVEAEATSAYGREVQARAAADSGVEFAASLLEKRYEQHPQSFYSNPEWFAGTLVRDSTSPRSRSRFAVFSAAESDTSGRTVRYGLVDESSKINLNALSAWVAAKTLTAAQAETMLTSLSPDLTVEIADAVLDWIDTDQTAMQNGAEIDYYQGLTPPYPCKDNQLDSLEELLLVRGMTPALLFGEDTNHNGVLDPNENDGAASPPLDNADGILQRGLSQFLTVYSREGSLRTDGQPRININQTDLAALYDAVAAQFGADTAKFILAYRLYGAASGSGSNSNTSGSNSNSASKTNTTSKSGNTSGGGSNMNSGGNTGSGSSKTGGNTSNSNSKSSGGNSTSGGGSNSNSSSSNKSSGGGSNASSSGAGSQKSSAGQTAKASTAATKKEPVTVAGMDISGGAKTTVKSLYELFGASTSGMIDGKTTTLKSPWPGDLAGLQANALTVIDGFSLNDNPYVDGRININLAPREILTGIPGITTTMVDAIVAAQDTSTSGQSSTSTDRLTTAWLVINSITDLNTLETLDPYITARGDVFHLQSVGYFDGGGPKARVEAVIDASQTPPQVVFMRDLTEMGGFSASHLPTVNSPSR